MHAYLQQRAVTKIKDVMIKLRAPWDNIKFKYKQESQKNPFLGVYRILFNREIHETLWQHPMRYTGCLTLTYFEN